MNAKSFNHPFIWWGLIALIFFIGPQLQEIIF